MEEEKVPPVTSESLTQPNPKKRRLRETTLTENEPVHTRASKRKQTHSLGELIHTREMERQKLHTCVPHSRKIVSLSVEACQHTLHAFSETCSTLWLSGRKAVEEVWRDLLTLNFNVFNVFNFYLMYSTHKTENLTYV